MIRHKFCWRLRNHELISFRPSSSVPLKHCLITLLTLVNPLDLEDLCRCPGVIAFRRPVDFFGRRRQRQFIFWINQFKNCFITIDVTLNRLYIQQQPMTIKIKFPIRYNCTLSYSAFWLTTRSPNPIVANVTKQKYIASK